ncbi:uncharacterized protein LOC128956936 [Oppia nitens]|uniref:uncharacterized protein LOC128956936 n=1 Tax=Oppia nitens TaxID=1686743 RepID=UPI0023D9C2F4|nr:uncharacterized protein LOC128956936 [Oppia nitens]
MYTNEWMWRINIGPDTGNINSFTMEIPVKHNNYTKITDWTTDKKFINKFTKRRYDSKTNQTLQLYNCIVYAMIGQTSTTINCSMTGPNITNVNSKSLTIDNWPPNDTTYPNEPVFVWTNDDRDVGGIWKLFKQLHICIKFYPINDPKIFSVWTVDNDYNRCAPEAYRLVRPKLIGRKLKAITYNHFDLNHLIGLWFNIDGQPMYCITPISPRFVDQCLSESKLIPFMSHCFQDNLPTLKTTIESHGSTVTDSTDANTTITTAVSVSPTKPLVVKLNTGIILLIVIIAIIIVIGIVVVFVVLIVYLKSKRSARNQQNQLSRHHHHQQQQPYNRSKSILNDSSIRSYSS